MSRVNNNILVSVIIPCFNADLYVKKAVESIMNQLYTNLEIIVINDCSTDGTKEILKSLEKIDSRIIYLENEVNLKLIKTLNKGLEVAKGKYIVRMDADDISHADRILKQVNYMENNPDIGVLGTNALFFGDNYKSHLTKKYEDNKIIQAQLFVESPFIHPSIMVKRELLIEVGGYSEKYDQVEDYGLWVELSKITQFANLRDALLDYRILSNSQTRLSQNKRSSRHIVLRTVLSTLLHKNSIAVNELELNNYTYSIYRANFEYIDLKVLKSIYSKLLEGVSNSHLKNFLAIRWIAVLLFTPKQFFKNFKIILFSSFTYIGIWQVFRQRILKI